MTSFVRQVRLLCLELYYPKYSYNYYNLLKFFKLYFCRNPEVFKSSFREKLKKKKEVEMPDVVQTTYFFLKHIFKTNS